MSYSARMNVRDLISAAANRLKRARIAEPGREAESLLAHALKRDIAWLLAHPEAAVTKSRARAYARLAARRARRLPFAYVVGEKYFYGRPFKVTKDVLVPRPETELLIQAVLDSSLHWNDDVTVLDVGAGSGAIGLTLEAERPGVRVRLYDVSKKALSVARTNARRLKLRNIHFAIFDVLRAGLPEPKKRPAAVVANLPYLPAATWKKAQPEVRREPKLALVSGKDGLDHYRALFNGLARWKRPPELLALEAEPGQFKELSRLVKALMPGARVEILKDLHGDERVLVAE